MVKFNPKKHFSRLKAFATHFILIAFLLNGVIAPTNIFAQNALNLPAPGTFISLSPSYAPPTLKGIKLDPQNPFTFDFIVDSGERNLYGEELKKESEKLIKYFMASLTMPEKDLWVNLNPEEPDRIIPAEFGQTAMGRDMLAQDYLLKQLTSSLLHPDTETGKKFWERVYSKAGTVNGVPEISSETMSKVWIVPDKAVVYEQKDRAFVVESRLKVLMKTAQDSTSDEEMLMREIILPATELSAKKQLENSSAPGNIQEEFMKEIILPEIEKEINEGAHFAQLRQIYHSLILAAWFKLNFQNNILNRAYANQHKIAGIQIGQKESAKKIFSQYVASLKAGVCDIIKEEYDPATKKIVPHKYFVGGGELIHISEKIEKKQDYAMLSDFQKQNLPTGKRGEYVVTMKAQQAQPSVDENKDSAMLSDEYKKSDNEFINELVGLFSNDFSFSKRDFREKFENKFWNGSGVGDLRDIVDKIANVLNNENFKIELVNKEESLEDFFSFIGINIMYNFSGRWNAKQGNACLTLIDNWFDRGLSFKDFKLKIWPKILKSWSGADYEITAEALQRWVGLLERFSEENKNRFFDAIASGPLGEMSDFNQSLSSIKKALESGFPEDILLDYLTSANPNVSFVEKTMNLYRFSIFEDHIMPFMNEYLSEEQRQKFQDNILRKIGQDTSIDAFGFHSYRRLWRTIQFIYHRTTWPGKGIERFWESDIQDETFTALRDELLTNDAWLDSWENFQKIMDLGIMLEYQKDFESIKSIFISVKFGEKNIKVPYLYTLDGDVSEWDLVDAVRIFVDRGLDENKAKLFLLRELVRSRITEASHDQTNTGLKSIELLKHQFYPRKKYLFKKYKVGNLWHFKHIGINKEQLEYFFFDLPSKIWQIDNLSVLDVAAYLMIYDGSFQNGQGANDFIDQLLLLKEHRSDVVQMFHGMVHGDHIPEIAKKIGITEKQFVQDFLLDPNLWKGGCLATKGDTLGSLMGEAGLSLQEAKDLINLLIKKCECSYYGNNESLFNHLISLKEQAGSAHLNVISQKLGLTHSETLRLLIDVEPKHISSPLSEYEIGLWAAAVEAGYSREELIKLKKLIQPLRDAVHFNDWLLELIALSKNEFLKREASRQKKPFKEIIKVFYEKIPENFGSDAVYIITRFFSVLTEQGFGPELLESWITEYKKRSSMLGGEKTNKKIIESIRSKLPDMGPQDFIEKVQQTSLKFKASDKERFLMFFFELFTVKSPDTGLEALNVLADKKIPFPEIQKMTKAWQLSPSLMLEIWKGIVDASKSDEIEEFLNSIQDPEEKEDYVRRIYLSWAQTYQENLRSYAETVFILMKKMNKSLEEAEQIILELYNMEEGRARVDALEALKSFKKIETMETFLLFLKRVEIKSEQAGKEVANISKWLEIFTEDELMRYLMPKDTKRSLDDILLDGAHESILTKHILPFLNTLKSEEEKRLFIQSVLLQIGEETSVLLNLDNDSFGRHSHTRFWQLLEQLNSLESKGGWKKNISNSELKDPLFMELRTEIFKNDLYLSNWKRFERLSVLIGLMANKELFELLNEYDKKIKEGNAEGDQKKINESTQIYDYYRYLILHPGMKDFDALKKMITDPESFLGLGDKDSPDELHSAKKPSRLLEIPYIKFGPEELLEGLILGKYDDLQVLNPMEIDLWATDLAPPVKTLKGGQLLQYLKENNLNNEEDIRTGLRKYVSDKISTMENLRHKNTLQKLIDQINNNVPFAEILSSTAQYRFTYDDLVKAGLPSTYVIRIIPKSDPQAIMTGSEAPSCMSFGSGKNNVYLFNPNTAFLALAQRRFDKEGKVHKRILATSVLTVDRKITKNINHLKDRINELESRDANLEEILGKDFLTQISSQAYLSADNVEAANNTGYITHGELTFDNLVKMSYKKFFNEYFRSIKNTKKGRPFDKSKILVGINYSDNLKNLADSEKNFYLGQAPIAYSDKTNEDVSVLKLKQDSENNTWDSFSGVHPLSYEDTLEVAFIENKAFRGKEYKNHVAGLEMELIALQYNEALNGIRGKNLSLGYYEEGRLAGYLIAYVGEKDDKPIIYISDFAVAHKKGKAAGSLLKELTQNIHGVIGKFKQEFNQEINVLMQTTTDENGSFQLLLPQENDSEITRGRKIARLKRMGLRVIEDSREEFYDGRIEFMLEAIPESERIPETTDNAMLSDQEKEDFKKVFPNLDLEKALEAPFEELVRDTQDPGYEKPDPSDKYHKYLINYWNNQKDVRLDWLKLLFDMKTQGEQFTYADFVKQLKKIHHDLLLGFSGESLYPPQTFMWYVDEEEDKELIKQNLERIAGKIFFGHRIKDFYNTLKNIVDNDSLYLNHDALTKELSRLVFDIVDDLFFEAGNNSLVWNLINAILRLNGLKGAEHGNLDIDYKTFKVKMGWMGVRRDKNNTDELIKGFYLNKFLPQIQKFNPDIKEYQEADNAMRTEEKSVDKTEYGGIDLAQTADPETRSINSFQKDDSYGGIDFNPSGIDLEIQKEGEGFEGSAEPLGEIPQIEGLVPVIINIVPLTDVKFLLGFENTDDAIPQNTPAKES